MGHYFAVTFRGICTMAGRFNTPFPEFHDENGNPREGYKLFFFANETTTKLATYNSIDRGVANSNPVVLDEFGRVPTSVFLKDEYYTVVLATPDSDDTAPTGDQIIWQDDYVSSSDFQIFSIRKVYNGNPNGHVSGTQGSAGVLPTECWDYTNNVLYICTSTGTTSTAVWTAVNIVPASAVVPPQGRLTGTSATPFMISDLSAAGTLYYTHDTGKLVPIYGGASYSMYEFTNELTLALNSTYQVANGIYDVFLYADADDNLAIGFGPSWGAGSGGSVTAGSCARGSGAGGAAITRVGGYYVNSAAMTINNGGTTFALSANRGLYVASVFVDGSNAQVSAHVSYGQSRKWGIWNAFNQRDVSLLVGDTTSSWTYGSSTVRQSNAASGNKGTVFCGLKDTEINITFGQNIIANPTNTTKDDYIGIGVDSTTVMSGRRGLFGLGISSGTVAGHGNAFAEHHIRAGILGISNINCLEGGNTSGNSVDHYGGSDDMMMRIRWRA